MTSAELCRDGVPRGAGKGGSAPRGARGDACGEDPDPERGPETGGEGQGSNQFSDSRPATLENSPRLSVTSVNPSDRAWAAIR